MHFEIERRYTGYPQDAYVPVRMNKQTATWAGKVTARLVSYGLMGSGIHPQYDVRVVCVADDGTRSVDYQTVLNGGIKPVEEARQ